MFRLLIIARTEEIAKQAAAWAVSEEAKGSFYEKQYEVSGLAMSIRVYPLWIDQKARKPTGNGLLLVAKAPGDLQAMEGFIESYKAMPIKFILYDGAPEEPGFEAKWDAKPMPKGLSIEFVEKLIAANNEVVKRVAKVFKNFDVSNTGRIEVAGLKSVATELVNEFEKDIYREGPENTAFEKSFGAGVASLEDLMEWWKSGGKNNPSQIGGTIKVIIDENPYFQTFIQSLKQIVIPNQSDKMVIGNFAVHANKVEAPGVALNFSIRTCGNNLDADFQEFAGPIGIGNYDPFVAISFRTANPTAALSQLQELIGSAIMLGKSLSVEFKTLLEFIEFKYGISNEKVLLAILPTDKGANAIDPINDIINSISHVIVADQVIKTDLCFATDLDRLATEERPVFDILLDGVSLNIEYKVNSEVNKYLNHMQSGALSLLPKTTRKIIASTAFVSDILKSAEGELEFDVTQEIKEAINDSMEEEEFKVPLKFMREEGAIPIREKLEEIPLLAAVHSFFKDHVIGIDIFTYAIGLFGIKFSLALPGLSSMLTF